LDLEHTTQKIHLQEQDHLVPNLEHQEEDRQQKTMDLDPETMIKTKKDLVLDFL